MAVSVGLVASHLSPDTIVVFSSFNFVSELDDDFLIFVLGVLLLSVELVSLHNCISRSQCMILLLRKCIFPFDFMLMLLCMPRNSSLKENRYACIYKGYNLVLHLRRVCCLSWFVCSFSSYH